MEGGEGAGALAARDMVVVVADEHERRARGRESIIHASSGRELCQIRQVVMSRQPMNATDK